MKRGGRSKPKCPECMRNMPLSAEDAARVADARKKKRALVAVECPLCGLGVCLKLAPEPKPRGEDALTFRCPVSGCHGHVVTTGVRSRWGCGECGGQWKNRVALVAAVRRIVERFAYRAKCYVERDGDLFPAAPGREPKRYEELVEREPLRRGPAAR